MHRQRGCAALESRMDSLEKERERKDIQCDIFSSFVSIFIMHIVFQRIL